MIELAQEARAEIAELPRLKADMPEEDPLLYKVPLPLRATFYPIGFAVEISTNAQEVLDAAAESWGSSPQRFDHPPLQYRIGAVDHGTEQCPPAPVVRAQRHLVSIIADRYNHALCDTREGFAYAWVNRGAISHRGYLRYHILESAVLTLINTSCAIAIHAGCVSRFGCGMLICGDSGAGKSSLAYGCAREGWVYTSDDASYLLLGSTEPNVFGEAQQIRFRPSARSLFPELHGRSLTPRAQGKPSIEVPISDLPDIITAEEARAHCAIFLDRQPGAEAELRPYPREKAMEYFKSSIDSYPMEAFPPATIASLDCLSKLRTFELHYSDLSQAVERLGQLAQSLASHR